MFFTWRIVNIQSFLTQAQKLSEPTLSGVAPADKSALQIVEK